MHELSHAVNWYFGWTSVLCGFLSGAAIGLYFHRDDFLGGYGSFRRRIVRLGHIALVALGMLNVLFSLSPLPAPARWEGAAASVLFVAGGCAMPTVCFLTGWRAGIRRLFFVPVLCLVAAVVLTIAGAAL